MAIDVEVVKTQATEAVLDALTSMYKDADKDSMRDFAAAIAQAAVVAVQNVIDHGETVVSGEGIR